MFNVVNPSPANAASLRVKQQKRWIEINAKPVWSDRDFEEALYCHAEYSPEKKDWIYPQAALEKLAFDARTPNAVAEKLQAVVKQMSTHKP